MKPISKFPRWLAFVCLFHLVDISEAQLTPDPNEVIALNTIFQRWGISSQSSGSPYQWNTTGDPCSGYALTSNARDIEVEKFNPAIICDCNYNNGSTCHIKSLKVMDMNVQGRIPEELINFTYLEFLKLDKNYLIGPLPAFLASLTKLQIFNKGSYLEKKTLRKKDFEIAKEAGGMFKGVVEELNVYVSESYLEIHLFWAGKSTQRIPEDGYYGSSISAIKFSPDFTPNVHGNPESPSSERTGLIVGIVVTVTVVISASLFTIFYMRRRKRKSIHKDEVSALNAILRRWGISPQPSNSSHQWYTTGDPCSGAALAKDAGIIDDETFNSGIICDCNYHDGSTCHIIRLKVMGMGMEGEIPNELLNLTYLVYLKLDKNYLTGLLPAFLARLTKLKILTVAFNSLSGPIPEELGTLKDLAVLSLEYNNFSGALPSQLGNLINLQHFYISSTGLSGEIPSSFSKLSNMKIMWASDNKFVGKIPDFIGNWTLLEDLRFQGNSFEGPIPSSFSSLTNLTELRISELSNTSSTLDFIKNMKNLVTLVLRNNMISGTIPSNIVEYSNLKRLDLSFNNLTGRIPSSLFTLQNLSILFLGNNGLFGPLPAQMGPNLVYIDLSYNELSGSFPPWVTKPNIHVNLVGNNFTFGESNISNFKGLECLQRNFPCNRGTPRYAKIAINCGGETMKDTNGDEFDQENYNMSATSYFVTDNRKWAVSNAGIFFDKANLSYIQSTTSPIQVGDTLTGALFQQVRLSPGSLRYYGLSMENGMYTVNLYFAETGFDWVAEYWKGFDWVSKNKRIDLAAESWKLFGRRIFDIYIQGDLKIKDFEIAKKADGMFKGISMDFKVNVTENYLEIHLFWAGKGTQRIPEDGSYGSSIAAIKFTPDFTPTVPGNPESPSSKRTGLIVFIVVVVTIVISTSVFAIFYMRQRKRKGIHKDEEILEITPRANIFSYVELRSATEDFNPKNKLGEGGFGAVYKGKLYDGRNVAVKQLSVVSPQGKNQFVTEIATISAVQHRNLVKLYGCCIEGDKRALVYEYLENKSLDKALFGKTHLCLDWPTRYEICLRTARGLAYLHEESNPRIIHRDVKASNILLDADLNPKISDFGLAKLYDEKKTHISTRVAGTIGYLAPEYAMRGHLTEKADVFGFGIVALEVLSGRPNADCSNLVTEKKYLLEWAWNLHEHHRELELMDQTLKEFDESEACRLIRVALLCTQASPTLRPSMSRVVAMLSGDIEVGEVTYRPGYLTDWQLNDIISSQASGSTFSTLMPSSTSSNPNLSMKGNSSPPTSVTQPMLHDSQREYVVLT